VDTPEIDPSGDGEASTPPPAEDAPRPRGRRAAQKPVEAAAEEAPKRRRGRKAPAEEAGEPVAEEKPRRRIAARAKPAAAAESVEADAAVEEAPKPRRSRARAVAPEAVEETESVVEEAAPKPRRSRAPAAAAEETAEAAAEVAAPPAPRRPLPRPRPRPGLRRKRTERAPELEDVLVYATARYVRSSARKARMVCHHIRGKSVPEARAILEFAPRGVAKDWSKLLASAVANAEHNFELIGDELRIKEAYADEGPTLKRFRPRAMGRATPIQKKTSHLSITLTPKE
jgi:ribosomal protein L22